MSPERKKEPVLTPPSVEEETRLQLKPVDSKPRKRSIPEGLWTKCDGCGELVFDKDVEEHHKVCTQCGHHFLLGARERIRMLTDPGGFEEMDALMESVDVLEFPGYVEKLEINRRKTGLRDAVLTGIARLEGRRAALGVMDFAFNGGSMGSVVGEKITRLIERGTGEGLPVILFSTGGGARMYEGVFSLMQMAKTCGALARHRKKRLAYISVLTNPTMGGVMASFASVGDLILSEPGGRIGFAGPRVIRDTTKTELPEDFQTAEFLLQHGLIDAIVPRAEMRARLAHYLDFIG